MLIYHWGEYFMALVIKKHLNEYLNRSAMILFYCKIYGRLLILISEQEQWHFAYFSLDFLQFLKKHFKNFYFLYSNMQKAAKSRVSTQVFMGYSLFHTSDYYIIT